MTDLNHTGNKTIYSSTFQHRQLIISFPYLISFTQQFIHTQTDKDTAYTHVFHNIIPSYPHTFHMQECTHTHMYTHTHTHTHMHIHIYGVKYYHNGSLGNYTDTNTSQHCILKMLIHM